MAASRFLLAVALALLLRPGEASVHEYRGLAFANKGNAFILHAGSEGLYAASPATANATAEDDEDAAAAADAFIRFDKIIFRRPEAIDSVKDATSAKVQVLLFEIEDREMIGGSAYGGQKAICCTSDLSKLGACTEGSVIYRPSQYAEFNETGVRPKGITFWAVTFGTVKRTAAEVIVLIVSMGYGVVTPTLGGLTSKVVMLGGTFFLATETLELVENLGAVNDLSGKARLFLVYPVAILDAAFVIWIFISLAKTIGKLQIYFKSTDVFNERWQYAWIIPAFWHVLTFSLLCVICYLWAPSQNSMRFAYDASEFFDRKDNLSLIRPAPSASKNGWSLSSTPDDKATKNVNTVTSFDEDDEENKRE
nr:unnamed protein product [Digitaria exilis]